MSAVCKQEAPKLQEITSDEVRQAGIKNRYLQIHRNRAIEIFFLYPLCLIIQIITW